MNQFVNHRENSGNPVTVMIHPNQWDSMTELVKLRAHEIDKEDGLVDAEVVMAELKIGKRRLANMISSREIPEEMYTVAVNGVKKFYIKKILGLEK